MNIVYASCFLLTFSASTAALGTEGAQGDDKAREGVDHNGGTTEQVKASADSAAENALDKFGFGPALYLIKYDDEVLKDSKDVKTRGDGTLSSSGSRYSVTLGVELHYDFSFGRKLKCYASCTDPKNWNVTSSHRISPFLGLFDIEGGINGIVAGVIYGYTKGDGKGNNKATLNFGFGWAVHKDRLVLSRDLQEGSPPPAGLNVEDYTERKDVKGLTLMVSANFGF